MAIVNPPLFLNLDGQYSARHLGVVYRDLVTEGVTTINGLKVEQNGTPNMSVNVLDGKAWVKGDDNPDTQPMYRVYNDGTVNLAIAAADPTNPRKDIVIAEVRDSQFSGVNNDSQLRVVTGTPAASPVEPALPNNALKLAVVDVPANDTAITNSQITDTRPLAQPGGELAAAGKLVIVCTSSTRPAHSEGLIIYETDTDGVYVSNGSAWVDIAPPGKPRFRAWRNGTQSIGFNTWVKVQLNAETYDPSSLFDSTTNFRFTPNRPGYYQFNGAVQMLSSGSAAGRLLGAGIGINGSVRAESVNESGGSSERSGAHVSDVFFMNGTTDYAELFAIQTYVNPSKNVEGGQATTYFSGYWTGA
jgi:hypothetical protein